MSRDPSMPRIAWWLVDLASRMLQEGEREAVRGDLEECNDSGSRALCGILGLVFRRQLASWGDWRAWASLFGLVLPLGLLLSLVSRSTANLSAIYLWMYANNLDWTLLLSRGYWYTLVQTVPDILMPSLALMCWAWASGFLLASSSRRTLWCNGALLCLMLLFGESIAAPHLLGHWLLLRNGRGYGGNRVVFAVRFYRVVFPLIVQAVLVLLPSLLGMRQSLRQGMRRTPFKVMLCVFAFVSILALVAQTSAWWQFRLVTVLPHGLLHLPSLMSFALVGPLGYLLATVSTRHRQPRKAVSQ